MTAQASLRTDRWHVDDGLWKHMVFCEKCVQLIQKILSIGQIREDQCIRLEKTTGLSMGTEKTTTRFTRVFARDDHS